MYRRPPLYQLRVARKPATSQASSVRDLLDGLGIDPVHGIRKPESDPLSEEVKLNDFKCIGSYNWIDTEVPTIIVPGAPSEWQDIPLPVQLEADTGPSRPLKNSYRLPNAPLLPLVIAVEMKSEHDLEEPFNWSSVDFVTNRNSLRKLLRWISDPWHKAFRIDMQLVGERTVLLNRWEKADSEDMGGKTYGYHFEEATTKPAEGCTGSVGHHRIVSYDLSGLKMVVRFEVNACIPSPAPEAGAIPNLKRANIDDLAASLSGMNLTESCRPGVEPAKGRNAQGDPLLYVKKAGSWDIQQESIVEITTRRAPGHKGKLEWSEKYPQMFLSQTGNYFLGIHTKGLVTKVKKTKIDSPELVETEQQMQPLLQKLVSALRSIQQIAMEVGREGRLSLVSRKGSPLLVYKRENSQDCLPEDIMAMLNGKS